MLFKNIVVALLSAGTALALPSYVGSYSPDYPSDVKQIIAHFMLHPVRKPLPKRSVGFNFGQDKVRGVNIGGWLLLEPYDYPFRFDFDLVLVVY